MLSSALIIAAALEAVAAVPVTWETLPLALEAEEEAEENAAEAAELRDEAALATDDETEAAPLLLDFKFEGIYGATPPAVPLALAVPVEPEPDAGPTSEDPSGPAATVPPSLEPGATLMVTTVTDGGIVTVAPVARIVAPVAVYPGTSVSVNVVSSPTAEYAAVMKRTIVERRILTGKIPTDG